MASRNNGTRHRTTQKHYADRTKRIKRQDHVQKPGISRHKAYHIPQSVRSIAPHEEEEKIIYVIDTNVIMNAYDAILNFKEHTVCITGQVWRELDDHKKGHTDSAWNTRKAIRLIDALVAGKTGDELKEGIPIVSTKEFEVDPLCTGQMVFDFRKPELPTHIDSIDLDIDHPDDRIIMVCVARQQDGERVVLISNDGNCRVKARLCGIEAEEYLGDIATAKGEEDLRPGFHVLPKGFWDTQDQQIIPKRMKSGETYTLTHQCLKDVYCNEFLVMEDDTLLHVVSRPRAKTVTAERVYPTKGVWGVVPRNKEQTMALHLLMRRDIPAVSIAGRAGSGKTYLALAAALHQTYELKLYDRIIVTRATVGATEEIGFLPGTEEEKMDPWMGAIHDNLEALVHPDDYSDGKVTKLSGRAITTEFLMKKMQIKSLNFMKGRTIARSIIIVDEVQDMTSKQLKMLATRVGEESKIIFLGNVAQIDASYLTELTCGLSVFIRTFAESNLVGHVTLQDGVRSSFATLVEELM